MNFDVLKLPIKSSPTNAYKWKWPKVGESGTGWWGTGGSGPAGGGFGGGPCPPGVLEIRLGFLASIVTMADINSTATLKHKTEGRLYKMKFSKGIIFKFLRQK